ncbi:DNA-binding transcriptional ArsR family regulator [Rhodoligotrophos appendicifer]|uniref:ArsR/SmtB family transcription factor n=1 Tax=Rhodoligotrophos appendicifer TaxID=987056 RepID=UPI0011867EAA|nr:metalloregulator ArsR/SmtB family transcription factor [Rhodoligotrophos appendicifer]
MPSPEPRDIQDARPPAAIFAALGDETRLTLVGRLALGQAQSIARLAEGSTLTRQAITKHLQVLEGAGLVHHLRVGRESRYQLDPAPLKAVQAYIDRVSGQWDEALMRLKRFVEDGSDPA